MQAFQDIALSFVRNACDWSDNSRSIKKFNVTPKCLFLNYAITVDFLKGLLQSQLACAFQIPESE